MDSTNKPYGWVKNGEYVLYIDKPDSVFNYRPLYIHPVNVTYDLTMEKCRQQQAEIDRLLTIAEDFQMLIVKQKAEIEALKVEREILFGFVKSRGEVGQLIVYKASLEAQEK